ncbi:MAG TPA: phosphoglycerate mutase family protein [Verrucomicrobiae bacterium]|nr:phosphoglycerate mutase family protein [Verrucomicrobiae bacterium]
MDNPKEADRPKLLVLVRHAESERNQLKKSNSYLPDDESAAIIRGVPDHLVPITDRGARQARTIGPHLRQHYGIFDVVYHSGYLRTKQTMDAALEAYTPEELSQMKIRESHLVRERFPGYAYNMTDAEVERNFPYIKEHWERYGPFYGVPPGGKSQCDVCGDVYTFIGLLRRVRAGKNVCVFTHGGTIRAFRYNLERWNATKYMELYMADPPENCGVTAYRLNEDTGNLDLTVYNQVFWSQSAVA